MSFESTASRRKLTDYGRKNLIGIAIEFTDTILVPKIEKSPRRDSFSPFIELVGLVGTYQLDHADLRSVEVSHLRRMIALEKLVLEKRRVRARGAKKLFAEVEEIAPKEVAQVNALPTADNARLPKKYDIARQDLSVFKELLSRRSQQRSSDLIIDALKKTIAERKRQ